MRNGYTSYKEARKHINFHASKVVESRQKSEVDASFKTITKVVSGKQFSRIEVNSCYDHPATSWSSGSKMHFKSHSFDLR